MIVVDTSAVIAVIADENQAAACTSVLVDNDTLLMSAGTLLECLIVASRRNLLEEVSRLIAGYGIEVVTVSEEAARRAADAHRQWGKGVHPAGLNFGDCFAYELAKSRGAKLLFIGDDFAKTDVDRAL